MKRFLDHFFLYWSKCSGPAAASLLCLLGLATAAVASDVQGSSSKIRFVAGKKLASISFPSISQDGQEKCNVTYTNHSVPEGTNVYVSLELDYPRDQGAGGLCCNIANNKGRWYTVVDLGPSKLHSDENTYICTVYYQADPRVPVTWKAANTSVTGGFSPAIPSTPDP